MAPLLLRVPTPDGPVLAVRDYPPAEGSARPGVPALLVGGLTRNARDYEDVAPFLAAPPEGRPRRVLCPDLRGRGASDRDPDASRYTLPATLDDLVRVADAADLSPRAGLVLIGASLGGILGLLWAGLLQPGRLAGLVLVDAAPESDPAGPARLARHVGSGIVPRNWAEAAARVAEVNGPVYPRFGPEDWLRLARRSYRETPDGLVSDYDPAIASAFRASQAAQASGGARRDLWAVFHALLGLPILLLRGALSDFVTEGIAARMQAAHPDLVRVDVLGVGHTPTLDEPEARAALLAFLSRIDAEHAPA